MIFVSHNHADKDLVEQFALRLRDTFGQDNVFYDSWSIQPGDGIVKKIDEALASCTLFLFFVSKNSLNSKMVELEWQNAIMQATKDKTRFVPVRMDNSMMPTIMQQTLYLDLFANGLEVTLRQVVDVAKGNNTFRSQEERFSNLHAYIYKEGDTIIVEIHAIHYMEPISHYLILSKNEKDELHIWPRGEPFARFGFQKDVPLNDGRKFNGHLSVIEQATVPGFPRIYEIKPRGSVTPQIAGVMHEKERELWVAIPLTLSRPQ